MIVVSDTTPIISLLKGKHLDLLQKLYGKVLVPHAVYRELTENTLYEEEAKVIYYGRQAQNNNNSSSL